MKVVIVGAGNVAHVFSKLIRRANHEMLQIVSRSLDNARQLAAELGCAYTNDPLELNLHADIYVVAMADAALNQIHEHYSLGDKLVVHTAGSIPMHSLNMVSKHYGVIYPLQSLRKENPVLQEDIPLLIGGNSPDALARIAGFAGSLSNRVQTVSDEERLKLHVAAVLVSNFTNHLYTLAAGYCHNEGINFSMLQPLIEETATRLRDHAPELMQTGPAIRKDIITLDKHLRLLTKYPSLKKIYMRITESIMNPG